MILRNLKILWIDDQLDYVVPISGYLEQKYQHKTTSVSSNERAQRKLEKESFDIIFVDYKLTGGTGIDFLKWATETKLETPVIMVTGHGREEVAVEAMKLGAYDYLSKMDITLDLLPVVINNTVDRFVLRKAKDELDAERMTKEKNALAIRIFQETVKEFIDRINNDLANILLKVKPHERAKGSKALADAAEQKVAKVLGEIEFSAKAIEATVSALVTLNATVTNLIDVQKKAVDLQQELDKTLKRLEDRKGTQ